MNGTGPTVKKRNRWESYYAFLFIRVMFFQPTIPILCHKSSAHPSHHPMTDVEGGKERFKKKKTTIRGKWWQWIGTVHHHHYGCLTIYFDYVIRIDPRGNTRSRLGENGSTTWLFSIASTVGEDPCTTSERHFKTIVVVVVVFVVGPYIGTVLDGGPIFRTRRWRGIATTTRRITTTVGIAIRIVRTTIVHRTIIVIIVSTHESNNNISSSSSRRSNRYHSSSWHGPLYPRYRDHQIPAFPLYQITGGISFGPYRCHRILAWYFAIGTGKLYSTRRRIPDATAATDNNKYDVQWLREKVKNPKINHSKNRIMIQILKENLIISLTRQWLLDTVWLETLRGTKAMGRNKNMSQRHIPFSVVLISKLGVWIYLVGKFLFFFFSFKPRLRLTCFWVSWQPVRILRDLITIAFVRAVIAPRIRRSQSPCHCVVVVDMWKTIGPESNTPMNKQMYHLMMIMMIQVCRCHRRCCRRRQYRMTEIANSGTRVFQRMITNAELPRGG